MTTTLTLTGEQAHHEDIAVADFNGDDFNGDGVPDIVTAEKGAPNFLYLGDSDPAKLGDFSGVTPVPIALEDARPHIALEDAPTWYESADAGSERLTWGQYKGEVDDTYQITPFDVDDDGDLDLVVGSRDQTAKV